MNVTQNTEPSHNNNKYNAPKTIDFRIKYKTQKCRYWEQQGYCPFGQMCAFAHDYQEIRNKGEIHTHYKTKPCLNFNKYGSCKYGDRCLFLHQINDIEDRDRTRSNSPNELPLATKPIGRHQQNLKILTQFGFSVFEAHMQRKHSKLIPLLQSFDQCSRISVSTQPELETQTQVFHSEIGDLNYCCQLQQNYQIHEWNDWNGYIQNEQKKLRMYSM